MGEQLVLRRALVAEDYDEEVAFACAEDQKVSKEQSEEKKEEKVLVLTESEDVEGEIS